MNYFVFSILILSIISSSTAEYKSKEELTKEFKELDENNDGYLDVHELRIVEDDDDIIFLNMVFFDADKDGRLSLEEFLFMNSSEGDENSFKIMDKDGDGHVSLDELREIFFQADELQANFITDELISLYDTNGDGVLDLEEFKRLAKEDSDDVNGEFFANFEEFDTNGDKKVTKQELRSVVLKTLNQESSDRAQADFLFADKDNDQKLSLEEFIQNMCE